MLEVSWKWNSESLFLSKLKLVVYLIRNCNIVSSSAVLLSTARFGKAYNDCMYSSWVKNFTLVSIFDSLILLLLVTLCLH